MSNIKVISVSEKCILCGLCDEEKVKGVFTYAENGKVTVANSGMVDLDLYPGIYETAKLCPVQAICITEPELSSYDTAGALEQFNRIVDQDLRGYAFGPPEYKSYSYETGQYQALPIPAQCRSEAKYLTEDMAEDAGALEFQKAVYSQKQHVAKQYLAAYKIKKLKQYYTYEETADNFYFRTNLEIRKLLHKAYQLALIVTEQELNLPADFLEFDLRPDWSGVQFALECLQKLEEQDVDLSRSGFLHTVDYYRTYIRVDGDFKHCYYDFTEAEKTFREDVDSAMWDIVERYVSDDVTALTDRYMQRVKTTVLEKCELLQSAVKNLAKRADADLFRTKVTDLYHRILSAELPEVKVPWPENFDLDYNDDYRFYSLRDCEEAAGNRRERGYKEGCDFVANIPSALNETYQRAFAELFTFWKREVLSAYDLAGRAYPDAEIIVRIGDTHAGISLTNHENVSCTADTSIRDFLMQYLWTNAVADYISQYECKIITHYDCDIKETIFGNIKEVNKRYCYNLDSLYKFVDSAYQISKACDHAVRESDFMEIYFDGIRKSFAEGLLKIAGVSV